MSDQDDDKKNINQDTTDNESVNQPSVDENNQPESVESAHIESSGDENKNNEQNNDQSDSTAASSEKKEENKNLETQISESNVEESNVQQSSDTSDEKKDEDNGSGHQVIHKKDGRLHIYVRQDKYKGELKSKNWVGRLYIDGKQKISSSGTTNLEEAIPILEKWFDDIQEESERLKNQTSQTQVDENQSVLKENISSEELSEVTKKCNESFLAERGYLALEDHPSNIEMVDNYIFYYRYYKFGKFYRWFRWIGCRK